MSDKNTIFITLLNRYDYGGVYDLLMDLGFDNKDITHIVDSCRYAINFDFDSALEILNRCSDKMLNERVIATLAKELKALKAGDVDVVFSELMENIKIQLINDEYIDFLGRIYRFKEAIFKYIFIKKHSEKGRIALNMELMSKRYQLKVLRKQYKVYNGNLCYAITSFFKKYHSDDYKAQEIVKILNSEKMNTLINLRNESIVGHGFRGVSRADIAKAFGNPYHVLDDFYQCLNILECKIFKYKYSKINAFIASLASNISLEITYPKQIPFE